MKPTAPRRVGSLHRRLDFFVGIPVVFLLGCVRKIFRGKRDVPPEIKQIGLLQTAAIGDTVLMSAVWRDLRQHYPDARVRVLAGESNLDISRLLFGEENVELLPTKKPLLSLRLARQMRFDVLIDFGPWPRWNAALGAMMSTRYHTGYATRGQYRHYAYDRAVHHSSRIHEVENQRALVAGLGITPTQLPGFPHEALARESADSSMTRTVILHAWPGGHKSFYREWPQDHWVDLGGRLSRAGFSIALSGGPGDRENSDHLEEAMREAGVRVTNWAGKIPLADLVKKIASAYAVFSVNTGVMHIAAATGTLTLGLHGPTSARRWGPIGPRAVAIESPCPGCGFLDLGFEYPLDVPPCMEAITVNQVWAKFLKEEEKGLAKPGESI